MTPKKWKNRPLKMHIIGPQLFFQYRPGCPNGPKTELLYHKKPFNAGLGIYTGYVCLFGTRSVWYVLLSSMIYELFKQRLIWILTQMNIFLLKRPFHSWFYIFLLFASSVRCWCFQKGIKNECNNHRCQIFDRNTKHILATF